MAPESTDNQFWPLKDTLAFSDALLGYAASHRASATGKPYLPCPDTNLDGSEENRTGGVCPSQEGWIPWATLGIGQADGWGNHIRYRVHPNFSDGVNGFDLTTSLTSPYQLRVCGTATCSTFVATGVAVVLVSHGTNGLGARTSSNVLNAPPTSADELANTDGRNLTDTADTSVATSSYDFVSRPATAVGAAAGEFDDVEAWLSSNILFGRMVAAGRLP